MNRKKITVKAMENLTETEIQQLIKDLKKINGFEFFVSSGFTIK